MTHLFNIVLLPILIQTMNEAYTFVASYVPANGLYFFVSRRWI